MLAHVSHTDRDEGMMTITRMALKALAFANEAGHAIWQGRREISKEASDAVLSIWSRRRQAGNIKLVFVLIFSS